MVHRAPLRLAVTVSCLAVFTPGFAEAQTRDVEDLYREANQLRRDHRDAEALTLLREILARGEDGRALAQVGLAEGASALWVEAEAHLSRALARADDRWVRRHRRDLERALSTARSHVGRVEVASPTPGAEVFVGGRRAGAAGEAVAVIAGEVEVEVRAPGFVTAQRRVSVAGGSFARERVELVAEAPAAPTNPVVASPVVASPVTAPAPTPTPPVVVAPAPRRAAASGRRTVAYVGIAAGSALIVGGVVAHVVGLGAVASFNDTCPGVGAPGLSSDCQSSLDRARALEPVGWSLVGVGAAALGVGLALLVTSPSSPERPSVLRCGGGPGTAGIACALRF